MISRTCGCPAARSQRLGAWRPIVGSLGTRDARGTERTLIGKGGQHGPELRTAAHGDLVLTCGKGHRRVADGGRQVSPFMNCSARAVTDVRDDFTVDEDVRTRPARKVDHRVGWYRPAQVIGTEESDLRHADRQRQLAELRSGADLIGGEKRTVMVSVVTGSKRNSPLPSVKPWNVRSPACTCSSSGDDALTPCRLTSRIPRSSRTCGSVIVTSGAGSSGGSLPGGSQLSIESRDTGALPQPEYASRRFRPRHRRPARGSRRRSPHRAVRPGSADRWSAGWADPPAEQSRPVLGEASQAVGAQQ